ncbi:MAG: M23 family metallopeptidase [Alphaproteobacteria bacterium]|nr:M23 family metallopeptidase [Alphaproteobacteria bacterium]
MAYAEPMVAFNGTVSPGGLIIGTTEPGNNVAVGGQPVRVSPTGMFLMGLGRDAAGDVRVDITAPDGGMAQQVVNIPTRNYDIQRIDGLPKKQVTPDPDTQARINRENSLIKAARRNDGATAYFATGFQWPVTGPVSGVFGSQRILNGEPRSPHNGVDIAAPEGTTIVAMADGVVTLVHDDMFYTGMTVMLDHGHGLTSVYVHMSDILVTNGAQVRKGTPIGKVGKTGRVTGPHLHWGVTLFATHLDPMLVAGPMPETGG